MSATDMLLVALTAAVSANTFATIYALYILKVEVKGAAKTLRDVNNQLREMRDEEKVLQDERAVEQSGSSSGS